MQNPIPRSYLFVPGNRPERFAKARAAGADAVIIDLEDAVPPTEKEAARKAIAGWLAPAQPVLIRINSSETEWFRDDAELCASPGVDGIVLPKAERLEDLRFLAECTDAQRPILAIIETARGFWNAHEVARGPAVRRLAFGSIDFQLDMGIDGEGEELLYFRSQLVLVSRVAGLEPPVDGVSTAIDDPATLRADTLRGRRLGFGAKLCIHPKQVAHVNECYSPSADEIAWAERVVQAAAAAHGAAVALDGKMIDTPVIRKAEAILSQTGRTR
jgi:citrate lyase subunit beta/citryl-CoA lyase